MAAFSKLELEIDYLENKLNYFLLLEMMKRRRLNRLLQRKRRRFGVRDLFKKREQYGAFNTLFKELHADRELYLFG